MRLPSVKTLSLIFNDKAKEARKIMEMSREELKQLPAGVKRVAECYNPPKTYDIRLHCLNALDSGLYGAEGVQNSKGEWLDYLNTGDCYAPTVCYWRGTYRVCSVADIVENPRNKF